MCVVNLNPRIFRMLDGTFSLNATQIILKKFINTDKKVTERATFVDNKIKMKDLEKESILVRLSSNKFEDFKIAFMGAATLNLLLAV